MRRPKALVLKRVLLLSVLVALSAAPVFGGGGVAFAASVLSDIRIQSVAAAIPGCPGGTLLAMFEVVCTDDDGDGYKDRSFVFEEPVGNEGLVTIDHFTPDDEGESIAGTWAADGATVDLVIFKAGTYWCNFTPANPGAGAFDNACVPEQDRHAISHVEFCGEPTAVNLLSFTAEANDGIVILAWETASEVDNAGLNLYRATAEDATYTKINDVLIPAHGDALSGASYTYEDAPGYGTFYYVLEDLDNQGNTKSHGPVGVGVEGPGSPSGLGKTIYLLVLSPR